MVVVEEVINVASTVGIGTLTNVGWSIGISVVRSVAGWLQHSLEDGKVDKFEISQLFDTILRILPQALGLGALGIPPLGAFITDVFVRLGEKKIKGK